MNEINIITEVEDKMEYHNIHGRENLFGDVTSTFSNEELKPAINSAINAVVELVDLQNLNSKGFDVAELTFTLNVNAEGKVSLLSCISGEVSAQSGITVKIVRKAKNEE